MKRTMITATLLAILSATAVSCQKEAEPVPSSVCSQSEHNVRYTIDNRIYHASLQTSEEWHTFLSDMLALTRQGHRISVQRTSTSSQILPTKDVVTFETTNMDEALEWANMMIEQGYEVFLEYDEESGLYSLTAKKD